MKLEEMKQIAEKRTPGEWKDWIEFRGAKRTNVIALKDKPEHWIGSVNVNDSDFIAMAANNWDKLMAVVEAAKKAQDNYRKSSGDWYDTELDEALEELEKDNE